MTLHAAPPDLDRAAEPAASTHDAIVVGARVAGAATAMLLARQGLRVLLLDRAAAPGSDTLSTHALMRGGVLQLHRWGLLDALRASGAPAVRRVTIHYGDEAEPIDLKERGGVDSLYGPRRTVLDPLLVEAAAAAGADVRYGIAVQGLLWQGERVVGVEGRDAAGSRLSARAPLVIGADGMLSLVARSVGAAYSWQGRHSSAFVYGYFAGVDLEGYEWLYREGGGAGIIPTHDGEACVWIGAPTERFLGELRHDLEEGFLRVLAEVSPSTYERVAGGERRGRLRGFPGVPGYLRRPWGPGWALVGDAGSYVDALSAHGISSALRDAELLAGAAVAAHRGERGSRPWQEYERLRDAVSLDLATITDEIAGYGWSLAELRPLLLASSKAMARGVLAVEELDRAAAAAA
ncbi:MAG TPA: NAD(P)/FAD-dependent oxidoreductase [Thermoanaerobaculia bacterium]|nr:NAD(P)/FAD-dependent oxidoreductase [Thermoanaerobaculia bacterium]